jgi:hypothetical protein
MFTGFVSQHHYVAVAGAKTTVNVVNASHSFFSPVQLRLLNITFEPEVFVELEYAIRNFRILGSITPTATGPGEQAPFGSSTDFDLTKNSF